MNTTSALQNDDRTNSELLRQWEKLNKVKNQLIKAGLLNGDATATDVLEALRAALPLE